MIQIGNEVLFKGMKAVVLDVQGLQLIILVDGQFLDVDTSQVEIVRR